MIALAEVGRSVRFVNIPLALGLIAVTAMTFTTSDAE